MSDHDLIYRYLESPLGSLIACTSSKGCCLLGFKERYKVVDIKSRFRKLYNVECVEGSHPTLDKLKKELRDYFKGNLRNFTIPLDLRGSTFELTVWEELLRIPYGVTRSYGDIAKAIGKPTASRAVGKANGNNPIAIIVPCHRVIASNGKLHGYGGGLWRKEKLLTLEKKKKVLTDFI